MEGPLPNLRLGLNYRRLTDTFFSEPIKYVAMHSWEVLCIEIEEDSHFDDCRAISKIGYKAPTLRKKSANAVGARIHQGHADWHANVDGHRFKLKGAKDPDKHFYARTLTEDSPDDPLLSLQKCSDLEKEKRYGNM